MMDEGPEQEALFQIEGPDEDGCVWICSSEGPRNKVAEVLSRWLASQDCDEGACD